MKSSSRSSRSLTGLLELVRGHGGPHRQVAGLRFLAAKAAAHAPAFHAHRVVGRCPARATPSAAPRRGAGCWSRPATGFAPAAARRRPGLPGRNAPGRRLRACRRSVCARALQRRLGIAALARTPAAAHSFAPSAPRARSGWRAGPRCGSLTCRAARRACITVSATTTPITWPMCCTVSQREHRLVVREVGQHRVAGDVARQHHVAHAGHGQRGAGVHAQQPCRAPRWTESGAAYSVPLHLGDVVHVGARRPAPGRGRFRESATPAARRRRADGGWRGWPAGRHARWRVTSGRRLHRG